MNEDNNYKEEIIKELMLEERSETDLIHIYKTMIDQGVVNCLPREQKQNFKEKISKLHHDSEKHLRMVFNLIEKYKNN